MKKENKIYHSIAKKTINFKIYLMNYILNKGNQFDTLNDNYQYTTDI